MAELTFLRRQRGYKRSVITKLYDSINSNIDEMNLQNKLDHIAKLEQLSLDIRMCDKSINSLICDEQISDEDFKTMMDENEHYGNKIITSITALKSCLSQPLIPEGEAGGYSGNNHQHTGNIGKLKLPEIPLPFYSHAKDESLDNFLTSFCSIVNKYSISSYEKFCLLKKQLSGEPLALINSLSTSQQSFDSAKELLEEAFASDTSKKFDAISRLANLKLEYGGNAYEFVGEMRSLETIFQNLTIQTNDILQFFYWKAMNNSLQNQLVNICNNNRPSFQEIKDNIFKAIDRYTEIYDRTKARREFSRSKPREHVNSFAADVEAIVNKRLPFCSLCTTGTNKDSGHATKDCSAYPTPESKVNRLSALGACTKCGFGNHSTDNCKFRFKRRCFNCEENHMTFLCINSHDSNRNSFHNVEDNKTKNQKIPRNKNVVSSNVVYTLSLQVGVGRTVLLPTFSCYVKDKYIRCMKDSGSQPNFIKTSLADSLNLKVIDRNVLVSVGGFNVSHDYTTKIVEVQLDVGNFSFKVEAICVREIRTILRLQGLSLAAKGVLSKGYKLADPCLTDGSDTISNLDFVLGKANPEVLLENQISFGKENVSVYSETHAGIMLYGNVSKMLANIPYLPDACSQSSVNVSHCETFCTVATDSEFESLHKEVSTELIPMDVNASCVVLNADGEIDDTKLLSATNKILNYDLDYYNDDNMEVNTRIVNFVLNKTTRDEGGRLIMPLPWKFDVLGQLGKNYKLSLQILNSNFRKLNKSLDKLEMMHNVFQEQADMGIIEKVESLDAVVNGNSNFSFLPHMAVFKLDRSTTKCRMVFLSNLCETSKGISTFSHNQCMHAGPNLNQKITTSLMSLRFGEKLITYDIKKAFNMISLYPEDSNKLLFLWYRDPLHGDFTPIAYRNIRLSFGLRASPCILMLALYKILCIDIEEDDSRMVEFKKLLYALLYMDNGAYSGNPDEVKWAYSQLHKVFNPYKFSLQQITSNEISIQNDYDRETGIDTPNVVKLLGLQWDRNKDQLIIPPINLNPDASSKRQVLQTLAAQYDVFNFRGPIMNRARLYLHNLQCDKTVSWDEKLPSVSLKEWRKIVKQANSSPSVTVDRFVGNRSDQYELIGFTDASNLIYAAVIYIKNLMTGKVSFLLGKHRLVNKQLSLKTIPSLELQALTLGVESILEVKKELCGELCMFPIDIVRMRVFCDSMICLQWLNSYTHKLEKMQKQNVFVINRLDCIVKKCTSDDCITFSFVATNSNTADCLSRAISYRTMMKFRYLEGPEFIADNIIDSILDVTVPNPSVLIPGPEVTSFVSVCSDNSTHLFPLDRFERLWKYNNIHFIVLKFVEKLKCAVARSKGTQRVAVGDRELLVKSMEIITVKEQRAKFPAEYDFLSSPTSLAKDIPPLINKMNIFLDRDGLLRVKSKFGRFDEDFNFPILLPKNSLLTEMIIRNLHEELSHVGCYSLINHLRKNFFIMNIFSTVKKILKRCVKCQRMNGRTVKLNQSSYRSFRSNPPCIPYRFIYVDYLGPIQVRISGSKVKIWLLLFTCLWSRGINIKICKDLTVSTFLKSLQAHVYEEGLPAKIFSDLGSQLTRAGEVVGDFLADVDTQSYLVENGIDSVNFETYFKGDSSLGSVVEICVKFVKRLLYGSIGKNVLDRDDFDLLISKTKYLLNSRPIAYKNLLSSNDELDIPEPITPELLNKGRNVICINVIPALRQGQDEDPSWINQNSPTEDMAKRLSKLRKIQEKMINLYNKEFTATLVSQAIDKNDRYKPIKHEKLSVGDIVLLREPMLKFHQYPLARVTKVYPNHLGEITDVEVVKGKTSEIVKRHVTAVVPYLKVNEDVGVSSSTLGQGMKTAPMRTKPLPAKRTRKAAKLSRIKTKAML